MVFTGEIAEIPLGPEGLTGNQNIAGLRPTQLIQAESLSYFVGTLKKEGGGSKYNSSAISSTPSIIQGYDWFPSEGTQRMIVVTSDGKILRDTGAGTFGTTVKSGLTVGNFCEIAEGGAESSGNNKKLFIATGSDVVQVIDGDGTTSSNISSPPTDWSGGNQPTTLAVHEGRLWGAGNNNDPHRVYYTTATDHEDFAGGGSISVYPGRGEAITRIVTFRGFLVVFKKPQGIYLIDTSDASTSNWRVAEITTALGVTSPGAIARTDNDLAFVDQVGGIHALSTVDDPGSIRSKSLSELRDINPLIDQDMNFGANDDKARMIYYPHKRELWIAMPSSGATTNNRRIVFSFIRDMQVQISSRDTPVSMWLREVSGIQRPVIGDDAGFVWDLDESARSLDGSGYQAKFQTAHTDLSFVDPPLGVLRKEGKFLELVMEPIGNWNLSVDIVWDGSVTQTVQFNMGTTGATLGSFVLGTDKLAGDAVLNKKKRITGGGRRFSIIGRNSGDSQDFSLSKAFLHYKRGSDRE